MTIRVHREGGVAFLSIDRPERRNALAGPQWTALGEQARQLAADPKLRAVILHGQGEHFCAGMDLNPDNPLIAQVGQAIFGHDRDAGVAVIRGLKADLAALGSLPVPLIVAVEGACAGGGLEVALRGDLIVASTQAWFSLPETRVGMVPDVGGSTLLTRKVGAANASYLALSGRRITADQALRWGLVQELCEPGQALQAAKALAADICKAGPQATRLALRALRQAAVLPLEKSLEHETQRGADALVSGEVPVGIAAFAQRKDPQWT